MSLSSFKLPSYVSIHYSFPLSSPSFHHPLNPTLVFQLNHLLAPCVISPPFLLLLIILLSLVLVLLLRFIFGLLLLLVFLLLFLILLLLLLSNSSSLTSLYLHFFSSLFIFLFL